MSVFAGLSYLSLLLVVLWTFLISLAYTGTGWVNIEGTFDVQTLMKLQSGDSSISSFGRKKRHVNSTPYPWEKAYPTYPTYPTITYPPYDFRQTFSYPAITYTTYDFRQTYSPDGSSDFMSGIMKYLPSMKKQLANIPSSVKSMNVYATIGFDKYCLKVDFKGSMKLVETVDMSMCVDNDLLYNPHKYGLPGATTSMLRQQVNEIQKAKVCLQIAMLFTVLVAVLMLAKPFVLSTKYKAHFYYFLAALSLVTMIIGASSLGFAQKQANLYEDPIKNLTTLYKATGSPSFFTIEMKVGRSIIYMSVAIVSLFIGIVVNLGELYYIKRSDKVIEFNSFGMRSQNTK